MAAPMKKRAVEDEMQEMEEEDEENMIDEGEYDGEEGDNSSEEQDEAIGQVRHVIKSVTHDNANHLQKSYHLFSYDSQKKIFSPNFFFVIDITYHAQPYSKINFFLVWSPQAYQKNIVVSSDPTDPWQTTPTQKIFWGFLNNTCISGQLSKFTATFYFLFRPLVSFCWQQFCWYRNVKLIVLYFQDVQISL